MKTTGSFNSLIIIIVVSGVIWPSSSRPYMRQFMDTEGDMHVLVDDMMLNEEQFRAHFSNARSGIMGKKYRWPGGIIPYQLANDYTEEQKELIHGSINSLNSLLKGCIKIRPARPSDKNRVHVQSKSGCFSSVGRQSGKSSQILSLKAKGCVTPGTVMHEFIHAIGFFHEQSRPDRDLYVELVPSNIKKGTENNFRKVSNTLTYGVPYDYKSIMHYRFNAFAKDRRKPTIKSKHPHIAETREMSSRYPTEYDILKIRRMYKCGDGDYGHLGSGHDYDWDSGYDSGDIDYNEFVLHGEGGGNAAAGDNFYDYFDTLDQAFGKEKTQQNQEPLHHDYYTEEANTPYYDYPGDTIQYYDF